MWFKKIVSEIYEDFKIWLSNQVCRSGGFLHRDLEIYVMMTRTDILYKAKESANRIIKAFKKYGYIRETGQCQYEFAR
jgi:hypothetical protein